ncbi:pyridoxamine 5'-phosphate oxidase family protein [Mitsuaria sp. GD03876]|uniref:2Fe-2S iron-sulfur cluster-binding protein n=1 Tax=Mitsuaria sp. GD03876 TaxID=2975399 RepID=UPI00244A05B8|nr:pyridoxamine 5'-phosphate oxidase family protein [Mitsuaria sp. GD03876]MDH0865428.1 pyridoxamine 5'-phosphate oxidase family protein [Mitsuaria sp. GD03876]
MGRAYSDITFTPTVREVQVEKGSREQYAFLDVMSERGDVLTPREAQFIAEADHFFQATVSETGWPYVQHRGGPKGFLKVLDAKTLGFADYRGNLHYLSVGNLRRDDRISLILVDFPNRRRLKLLGRVRLVEAGESAEADAAIAAVRDDSYGATVERAFVITIEGWDWNCPQHITPRFTEAEVASLMAPMRAQVQKLKAQLAEAKAALTAANAGAAPGAVSGAAPGAAPGAASGAVSGAAPGATSGSAPGATSGDAFGGADGARSGVTEPLVLGDGPLALTITGVRQLTPSVRAFELRSTDGSALPAVIAGAHLDVPVRLADGTASTRSYSIASSPDRTDAYEIAVQREPDGKGGSTAAHEDFALGVRLNCSMPRNLFALADDPHGSDDSNGPTRRSRRSVLIAGGIGITPIKAMAHALAARGLDFELHYAVRARSQAAFLGELIAAFGERVKVHAKDEGGRLDVAALMRGLGDDDHVYTCGPTRLIDAVTASAAAAGVDGARVHVEKFSVDAAKAGDREFVVHLVRSRKDLVVPVGRSILEVAEAQGVRVPASCRTGTCGTCATPVIDGTPAHRDEVLTAAQRSDERLMCVCVSRAEGEALTLDL